MRKIDLTPYTVDVPGADQPVTVNVKDNVVGLLYGDGRLTGLELLKRHTLAEKVNAAGDEVLLEEADYDVIQKQVTSSGVFSRAFVEFVRRVLEAPSVDVKAA